MHNRIRRSLTIAILLCSTPLVAQHIIAVKFKENSTAYLTWLAAGRSSEIEFITKMFGSHQTRPLIADATLKIVRKREQENGLRKSYPTIADNLERLCSIEFPVEKNAKILVGKLRARAEFEYAELLPDRHFSAEPPNDPFIDKQYHLGIVRAFEAWEHIDSSAAPLPLAIVDTGVDYLHEDLSPVMYVNPGEDGLDSQGLNKRDNGIDDDNNGYIDDWHGWDFVSSTSPDGQDNDPMPGNPHGTHVAGIAGAAINNGIGVAGAAIQVRLLPVKIGNDIGSNSVENSYNGLLYAAGIGAKVINCSWGGEASSESEAEVALAAQKLGAVIVAAAGNDGKNTAFYPAAYPGVFSVAATDETDHKAGFSNFHGSVDACAPGRNIYSTTPKNSYGYNSGTSMASPVCAALASLVRLKFPDYSPDQVAAHIKASCDNIDTLNTEFEGKLGAGRVNFLKSVTTSNLKWAELTSYRLSEEFPDGIFSPNERITVHLAARNILSPLADAHLTIDCTSWQNLSATPAELHIGPMSSNEEISPNETFSFVIPSNIPPNFSLQWTVTISDSGMTSHGFFSLIVNPTYRTMDANNISATFNSCGNIAYNDYPSNEQGEGFHYKNSANLLYEGALIIGTSADRLSDAARSDIQSLQNRSFISDSMFSTQKPGKISLMDGSASFADLNGANDAGVHVEQHCYQFFGGGRENFIVVAYDITNSTTTELNNLHAGLYFDWDVGASGSDNIAAFNGHEGYGYAYNASDTTLPYVASALLTNQKLNYFAMDNAGSTDDNPGVYDGFTNVEKWRVASGGLARLESSKGDISMIIAAGPITIGAGKTERVAFAIGGSAQKNELDAGVRDVRKAAEEMQIASGFHFDPLPETPTLTAIFPNSIAGGSSCEAEFYLSAAATNVALTIHDLLGKEVKRLNIGAFNYGFHRIRADLQDFAQGLYFIRLNAGGARNALPLTITR